MHRAAHWHVPAIRRHRAGRVAGAHAGDGAAKPCHQRAHGRRDDGGAGADGGAAAEHYAEGAQRVGADLRRGRGTGIPGPSEAGHIAENRLEALQRRAGRAAARVPVHHCRAARRRQNGFCPASGRAACQALPRGLQKPGNDEGAACAPRAVAGMHDQFHPLSGPRPERKRAEAHSALRRPAWGTCTL